MTLPDAGRWLEVAAPRGWRDNRFVSSPLTSTQGEGYARSRRRWRTCRGTHGRDGGMSSLVCGDFNVKVPAGRHQELEAEPQQSARASSMRRSGAFLNQWWTRLATPYVTWRRAGTLPWWSWRIGAFVNNAGWRIDTSTRRRPWGSARSSRLVSADEYAGVSRITRPVRDLRLSIVSLTRPWLAWVQVS